MRKLSSVNRCKSNLRKIFLRAEVYYSFLRFGSSGFLRFKDILVALNIDGTVSDEKISSFDMLPQPLRMISKIIEVCALMATLIS